MSEQKVAARPSGTEVQRRLGSRGGAQKAAKRTERLQTVVIGGGQAGLAVGYHLARRGLAFTILEANQRIGESWRKRWDSLRLFTPARLNRLPGMPFPAPPHSFPTKDEVADYLEAYWRRFDLPVRLGVTVDRLTRQGERFVLTAGERRYEADNVVVAMASYQVPWVPSYAQDLVPDIIPMHSSEYRNPSQLQDGAVLVVGAGNSGVEIALEVVPDHPTWLSGRDTGHTPFRTEGIMGRLQFRLMWLVGHYLLNVNTAIGRKVRPQFISHGGPLIRVKSQDLLDAGIRRVPRTIGAAFGQPVVQDSRIPEVANVVWCTGYRPGFGWIDLPIFDEKDAREPMHDRGIVPSVPGLYFVGLFFQTSETSSLIGGVGRDAAYVVDHLASRSG